MSWNSRREQHLRTWVVQMTKASTLMMRAASWLSRGATCITLLSHFCTAYTSIIPVSTLGCPMVSESTCVNLMFSAIIVAVIGSILALMEGKLDLNDKAKDLQIGAKNITQLARRIDLQLQRDIQTRTDVDQFHEDIACEYDNIMRNLPPVPRLLFKASDLMNFTLLSAYIDAPNTPPNAPIDDFLAEKLRYEMERLENHLS